MKVGKHKYHLFQYGLVFTEILISKKKKNYLSKSEERVSVFGDEDM